ncbi:Rieske 2Fe-2S domain-containing protein [Nocardiopsis sp. NPDC101807]|uniref:Rieske 2Fe-2S domain-containing protein n=1 Tax=Nocardiopsis sp. NPDC101807 TaxID=3364339 RepID=UPI0038285040
MRLGEDVRKIERNDGLDPAVSLLGRVAERIPRGRARDLLNGVQLGHPVHPILVQLPIGAWMSAVLLDLLPGDHRRSAHALVNTGLLATLPAVASGLADWSQQHGRQQRVGVVHAASNAAGSLLFASSSLARARDRRGWGKVLALAGMGAVALGGSLGGHIAYYRAGGANSADHLNDLAPDGWHDLGPLDGFGEGEPVRAALGDVPVVVVRTGDAVRAVLGTCTHMGAPLADGSVVNGCLRCPWHGSEFDMDDGSVVHGPATAGLETLETSVTGGTVRVRHRPPDA